MPVSEADKAVLFFRKLLRHTHGEWRGRPFVLLPWQEEVIRAIWGRRDAEGYRIVRSVYLEIPKKNGKTELAAGIALLVLCLSPGTCHVYIAAAGMRQTQHVYRAAAAMVEQHPQLARRLRVLRGYSRIVWRDNPDRYIQAIPADGHLTDGASPTCVIADELHRWHTQKQLENWDVLTLGTMLHREALVVAITTAGHREESPLAWSLHERALSAIDDPAYYSRIYTIPAGADWKDESAWIAANPSLDCHGGFLSLERLREHYRQALSDPMAAASFRRYHLNIWDDRENRRAIDMTAWDACAGNWQARGWPYIRDDHDLLRELIDRECYIGVDVSMSTDLTAVVLVFPDAKHYRVIPFFWVPGARLLEREHREGVPYRAWAAAGYVEIVDGELIEPRPVLERIMWAVEMFEVRCVAMDPYGSRGIARELIDQGVHVEEVRQTMRELSPATRELLESVTARRLSHGGHPVLRHHASCLDLHRDDNDLMRPAKPQRERSRLRIDGISATVCALSRILLDRESGASVSPRVRLL